jgi:hypothetical protein
LTPQADADSTSFADYEDASKFMEAQIDPMTGKRKRGRPRKYRPQTQEHIDVGSEARSGTLLAFGWLLARVTRLGEFSLIG